ncbi:hypothetical protein AB4Y44_42930, partial [Paraburkholderia sp. BR10937]
RYAGGGTIIQGNKLICTSGVLDLFDSEEEAQDAGIAWARAWVGLGSGIRSQGGAIPLARFSKTSATRAPSPR